MKTCSKCHVEQSETEFVKSARYKDGRYPHCKTCGRKKLADYLASNPTCIRCKKEPHHKNHPYCYSCNRIMCGRSAHRIRRKAIAPHLCPICNVRPKSEYQGYCRPCANEKKKEWIKSKGGQWAYADSTGQRHKLVARAYVNHLVQRNQLTKLPCDVCGKLETEAHHNSYENALDIRWLCEEHHDALERWLRMKRKQSVDESVPTQ